MLHCFRLSCKVERAHGHENPEWRLQHHPATEHAQRLHLAVRTRLCAGQQPTAGQMQPVAHASALVSNCSLSPSESYKSRMTTAMYRQGGQEFIVVIFRKNAKTWVPAHDPEPSLSVTLLLRACALRRRRALAQHGTTWATSSYPPRQIGPAWPFQLQ